MIFLTTKAVAEFKELSGNLVLFPYPTIQDFKWSILNQCIRFIYGIYMMSKILFLNTTWHLADKKHMQLFISLIFNC